MINIIPFASDLFKDIITTSEMAVVWSEDNLIRKWMDVEKAVTETQAELGIIPRDEAEEILQKLSIKNITAEHILLQKKTIGHLFTSFIKAFRKACGSSAEHFHLGPTTQDILDTGLILQMREADEIIFRNTINLENTLCNQAHRYKDTVMMGRTHQQHAVPTTLGFVMACWALEISDHIEKANESKKRWLVGNLTGVVGTQGSFVELVGVETASRIQDIVCTKLGLNPPAISPHTRVDRFGEVVSNLSGLCSSLGRIGLNIRNWQQSEVSEVEEPYKHEEYYSSTLPNKKNPESSEIVEGLANITRALASSMQSLNVPVTRDSTRIPVQFVSIPSTYMFTSKALEIISRNIGGLIVNSKNMLRNINHPNVLQQAAAERIMIAIYKKTKKKDVAHTLLHNCARKSHEQKISFKKAILQDEELSKLFEGSELENLIDVTSYTGTARQQIERTIDLIKRRRELRTT